MYYQNYHKHTSLSHRYNKDSSLVPMDYFKAMKPLADNGIPQIYSTLEHAWQGNYFKIYSDLEKFNKKNSETNPNYKPIKFIFGVEAYWVWDRFEKDNANCHIVLLAKNDNGRKKLNRLIYESYKTGYYYKGRIDVDLLLKLPKDDVMVTTACVAFWNQYNIDKLDDFVLKLNNHFTDFYLEVQANNTDLQKQVNSHIIDLHKRYHIPIISATDSHYISNSQIVERDELLQSNKIQYPDEDGNYMDFPSCDELIKRYQEQGILSQDEIIEAIENTNRILDFEDIVLDKSIKVPVAKKYKNLSQEERNKLLFNILVDEWKLQRKDINEDLLEEYQKEIFNNYNEVIACGMADYFIDSYEIMKLGQEKYGGILTPSGRGSGVSFYINKLLRLTKVDKVNSPVTMYAERFLTSTRVLESKTPPDIDNNVSDREPFIQAQRDLIGEEGTFDLLALGTLKYKSAFKMYARVYNLDPQLANEVTKQIDEYENALKHMEDDETEDDYDIFDYVDKEKYGYLIEGCQKYRGIVDTLKSHPCGTLCYGGDAIEDVGVIMVRSESTGRECFVALQESSTIDEFGYLKQDYLVVDSIGLTYDIYKEIGIEPMTVNELLEVIDGDKATWDIYANGYTMCINQVEKQKTTQKAMKYKPQNISELCQFIAGIRPSFQSMYNVFESRKHFDYGVKAFDDVVQDKYMTSSFLLYQETLMKVLGFAGFPMSETYTIIKAISKKKKYVIDGAREKFIPNFTKAILDTKETEDEDIAKQMAEKVWTVIESSASYGFNCLSGKTKLYRDKNGNQTLTIEEMYNIMNDKEYAIRTGHASLHSKYKNKGYGTCYSLGNDGRIYQNKIIDIYKQPKALTYKITTKEGREIIATANHKFPIDEKGNTKVLSELKVGDKLIVKGQYESTKETYNLTNGDFESNLPKKGEIGFQKKENGDYVVYNKFRIEQVINKKCCEDCGIEYNGAKRFEVHHVDFNRLHNETENYAWLCASCHKKRHFKHGRNAKWDKGCPIEYDEIISIEENEIEDVYDVSVSGDVSHTFLIDNGIMTSNCSHSYCMAIDSVTLAWLKAHYPLEFYKCALQRYTDKGNKDKVVALKKEMILLGVDLIPVKFGDDNRGFSINKEKHIINQTMTSIKNMGRHVADNLYALKDNKYSKFVDILYDIWRYKCCNKTELDMLIKINYFSDFGNINTLLAKRDMFNWCMFNKSSTTDTKKTIKVTDCKDEYVKFVVSKHCAKQSEKQFSGIDNLAIAQELESTIKTIKTDALQELSYEVTYLGYTDKIIPNSPYMAVLNVEKNKYGTPFVTLYSIATGATSTIKMNRVSYESLPLYQGDIIECMLDVKPKRRKVTEKTEDGTEKSVWIETGDYETVINNYVVRLETEVTN